MEQRFSLASRICGGVAAGIAAVVMLGWVIGAPGMVGRLGPSGSPMAFGSAVAALLAGLALAVRRTSWLGQEQGHAAGTWEEVTAWKGWALWVRISGGAVLAIGLLALSWHVAGLDLGVQRVVHAQLRSIDGAPPGGRITAAAAVGFTLVGAGLLLLLAARRGSLAVQVMAAGVGLTGFIVVVAFLYGVDLPGETGLLRNVAPLAGVTFCLLALGLVFAQPSVGLMAVVSSDTLAGAMGRRLLSLAVVIPVVLGLLRVASGAAGWFDAALGTVLLVTANVVLFFVLSLVVVAGLYRLEAERGRAREALVRSEGHLRGVLDALPLPVFISDAGGKLVATNAAAGELWGGSPPRSEGPAAYGADYPAWWPETGERVRSEEWGLARALATGETVAAEEMEVQTQEGRRRILNYALPIRGPGGEITGGVALNVDITERKAAEEAIRESEERLAYALEGGGLGVWELDLSSGEAWRSLKHDQIFGYEALLPRWTFDDFLGHVLEEDRGAVERTFREAVEGHYEWRFECRIRRADGRVRWIWAQGTHRGRPGGGEGSRLFGIVRDITERKAVEEALRGERELLRQVIDATPSMIFVKDWEGRFVLVNEAVARTYGTTVEGLLGKTDGDFNGNADEVAAFHRDDREVMLTRRPKLIDEETVTGADGQEKWYSTYKIPLVEPAAGGDSGADGDAGADADRLQPGAERGGCAGGAGTGGGAGVGGAGGRKGGGAGADRGRG